MPAEGLDVSHNNGSIDWNRVKAAGISFAYIKATEGATFIDPKWEENLAACRDVDIVPGLYHFYHHDADPDVQAHHFLQTIGSLQPGDLPPAVDVEAPGDGAGPIAYPPTEVVERVASVVRMVDAALGREPLIYTYPSAWRDITTDSNAFATVCPLWVASYANAPAIPGGWASYTVWQYTDHGQVDGIPTIVDRDRLSGDVDLASVSTHGLAAGEMALITQDANVRDAPGLTSSVIRVLPRGTGVVIDDGPQMVKDRDWWKVDDGEGTVGWCSGKLLSAG